jgi:hypothetical protein
MVCPASSFVFILTLNPSGLNEDELEEYIEISGNF